jgi:hypothetical protein
MNNMEVDVLIMFGSSPLFYCTLYLSYIREYKREVHICYVIIRICTSHLKGRQIYADTLLDCSVQSPVHPLSHTHRLNMEFDLQSLFGLLEYSCSHWLRPRNPVPIPPQGSYTRALLVSQDRRHLFVKP